jgi:phosphoserine phosphatase
VSASQLSSKATEFIESVLSKKPTIAAFDCDGTLWNGDSGMAFFYWEIEQGLISREVADWALERYELYKAGTVDELTICGEMVTIHSGTSLAKVRESAKQFFAGHVEKDIFAEMLELTRRLAEQGCEIWAVSSTNNWVVEAGAEKFGIPAERVLAATEANEGGCASDRLLRVPTDELKAAAIRESIARPVDAVFGNSMHDFHMLEIARDAYAVNPNPDLVPEAEKRGWTVYWPDSVRR